MSSPSFTFSADDHKWMAMAIQSAHSSRFIAKPNPNVGCVIVKDQKVLAIGATQTPGSAHAEINALEKIDHEASGATCYVTLEPCAHYGRTGPCAVALVKAQVKKVVIACLDPNPQVSGKGVKILEDAGVEVVHGLMADQVENQLSGFLTRMRFNRPKTTLKLGCSLDGNIALKNGESKWITSKESRQDVQVHRALSGAILTTSQTVIADNPSMNVRQEEWPLEENFGTQPLKAVLDRTLSTEPTATIYQGNAVVFMHKNSCAQSKMDAFIEKGIKLIDVELKDDQLDFNQVLLELGKLEINDVWIECGAKMAGFLMQENFIDTFIMYQAPVLLGNGINCMGFNIESMQNKIQLQPVQTRQIGNDIKMTFERTAKK